MAEGRHYRRGGRRRPPWWPEDEAWPPDRGAWRAMRGRFIRRVALLFISLVGLIFAASVVAFWHFGRGGYEHGGWRGAPVFGILLIVAGASFVLRLLRRTTAPFGELMDATSRLAAGDFGVRVRAQGAPETRGLIRSFNALAERLERTETERRNLIADVTHELRTPLSVIRGTAEAIVDGVYPGDAAHAGPIAEQAELMARLLEDLSTLSTAEAGQLSLHLEEVSARELVDAAIAAYGARFEAAAVRLTGEASAGLPPLRVDPLRIRQVLSNLLDNALRHTPAGGSVSVSASAADQGEVVFEVADTGSGIAPDEIAHVFERFRKADDSTGSGLGLAIARGFVEAHGGRIEAENRDPHGTRIRFSLPGSGSA